jgi:hypothetical protein
MGVKEMSRIRTASSERLRSLTSRAMAMLPFSSSGPMLIPAGHFRYTHSQRTSSRRRAWFGWCK